jgi:protein-L-isoaspartate(D-aspartate) O-methyltransferase
MSKNQFFEYLKRSQGFKSKELEQAFEAVDRKDFVPESFQNAAYGDFPLPIGFGGTISQPSTVLFMLNLLDPKPGEKVLDIGSGSGWTTALLAAAVGKKGKVFGVELVPELVEFGQNNLNKYEFLNAEIRQANEDEPGLMVEKPFDKILVSAAAGDLPKNLIDQLRIGGRMVIPIRNSVWRIDKVSDNKIMQQEYPGFAFVPLR